MNTLGSGFDEPTQSMLRLDSTARSLSFHKMRVQAVATVGAAMSRATARAKASVTRRKIRFPTVRREGVNGFPYPVIGQLYRQQLARVVEFTHVRTRFTAPERSALRVPSKISP